MPKLYTNLSLRFRKITILQLRCEDDLCFIKIVLIVNLKNVIFNRCPIKQITFQVKVGENNFSFEKKVQFEQLSRKLKQLAR